MKNSWNVATKKHEKHAAKRQKSESCTTQVLFSRQACTGTHEKSLSSDRKGTFWA
jgi:hypothetical protein